MEVNDMTIQQQVKIMMDNYEREMALNVKIYKKKQRRK